MLSRTHRFHGYNSLQSVYKRGQTARGVLVSLRYVQRSTGQPYRVAVVVSKKVSKSAVTRNRIRRRIYEAIRTTDPAIPNGYDLVFTVFSDQLATSDAALLRSAITDLLVKLR